MHSVTKYMNGMINFTSYYNYNYITWYIPISENICCMFVTTVFWAINNKIWEFSDFAQGNSFSTCPKWTKNYQHPTQNTHKKNLNITDWVPHNFVEIQFFLLITSERLVIELWFITELSINISCMSLIIMCCFQVIRTL